MRITQAAGRPLGDRHSERQARAGERMAAVVLRLAVAGSLGNASVLIGYE